MKHEPEIEQTNMEYSTINNKSAAPSAENRHRHQQQITCNINEDILHNMTTSSIDSLEMADQMKKSQGALT